LTIENEATPSGAENETSLTPAPDTQVEGASSDAPPPAPPRASVIPGRAGLEEIYRKRTRTVSTETGGAVPLPPPSASDDEEGVDGDTFPDGTGQEEPPPAAAAPPSPPPEEEPPEPAPAPVTPTPPTSPPTAAAAPAPGNELEPPPGHRAVMVNGQVRFVAEAELDKYVGLGLSAQQRFDEAARMRDEAHRIAARAEPTPAPAPAAPAPAPSAPESEIDVDALVDAIQFGDKDDAKKHIVTLIETVTKGRTADATPPEQVQAALVAQVLDQINFQTDLNKFGEDYADLVSDPDLARATAERVNEIRVRHLMALGYDERQLRSANPDLVFQTFRAEQRKGRAHPDRKVFELAGNAVRAKFAPLLQKPPAQPASAPPANPTPARPAAPPTAAQRLEVTRAAPSTPRPANARFAPASPDAPPPKTQRDVINEIRRKRGQPVYD
jgi:hypothetical protein